MKKIVILIVIITITACIPPKINAQAESVLIEVLTGITESLGALQVAEAITQTALMGEKLDKIRAKYAEIQGYILLTEEIINIDELMDVQAFTLKEYYAALDIMAHCKITLTTKETKYLVGLMNIATFDDQNALIDDMINAVLEDYNNIFNILLGGNDATSLIEMVEYAQETRRKVFRTYAVTKSCQRFVRAYVRRIEHEAGIYDLERIQKQVDQKIAKYFKEQ